MTLQPVTGLVTRITVGDDFFFYDTDSRNYRDMAGGTITPVAGMPTVTFSGNEGQGHVTITDPNAGRGFHYEVAVLRPKTGVIEPYNRDQLPTYGYESVAPDGTRSLVFNTGSTPGADG